MSDQKAHKYYPAEDDAQLKKVCIDYFPGIILLTLYIQARKSLRPTKYRSSLQPGTVLILLAGRFRGKRVILLRQLSGGVLLITGPFRSNGVPLRRVNHRYVIATSTIVDISGVDNKLLDKVSEEDYFTKGKESRGKGEEDFFKQGEKPQKKEIDSSKVDDQKAVDKAIMANVRKVENLSQYLSSSFSLRRSERPHVMVF